MGDQEYQRMNDLLVRHGVFYHWGDTARFLTVLIGVVFIIALAILLIGGAVILWRRMMTREDNREKGDISLRNAIDDRLRALECRTIPHREEE